MYLFNMIWLQHQINMLFTFSQKTSTWICLQATQSLLIDKSRATWYGSYHLPLASMLLSTVQVDLFINHVLRRYEKILTFRISTLFMISFLLPCPFVSLPHCYPLAADQDALSQLCVELPSAPEVHQPPVSRLAPRFWWIWHVILDQKADVFSCFLER